MYLPSLLPFQEVKVSLHDKIRYFGRSVGYPINTLTNWYADFYNQELGWNLRDTKKLIVPFTKSREKQSTQLFQSVLQNY